MLYMLNFFNNLEIRYKITIIIISTLLISSILTGFLSDALLSHEVSTINESELKNLTNQLVSMTHTLAKITVENRLKSYCDSTTAIMAHYYQIYWDGMMTNKQALTDASMFTDEKILNGAGFIFLIKKDGTILKHPLEHLLNHHISEYLKSLEFLNKNEGFFENTLSENKNKHILMYSKLFEPWDLYVCAVIPKNKMFLLVNTEVIKNHISAIRFGKTGYPYVLDSKGNILIHPVYSDTNIFDISPRENWPDFKKILENKSGRINYKWQNPGDPFPREKIVYYKHIPELNWVLCTSSYKDEYEYTLNRLRMFTGLIYLITLIIIIPIIIKITNNMIIPLKKIMNSFKKGAIGNYNTRVHIKHKDEIGKLAEYYNTFMDHLEKEIQERFIAEEKLKTLSENLEERVHQRTLELEIANNELESFSSTVSHDLKSPIGIISGMAQILNDNIKDEKPAKEENLKITSNILSTTKRMEILINDLLQFSKINKYEMIVERFNASEIINDIARRLASVNKKRNVEFIIEDDVYIEGDKNLLTAALENLVNNAYKFTNRKEMAIIEFGIMEEHKKSTPGRNTYYIKDNGAGFDMKEYSKLFSAFQRLHSQEDFKGTGIGLANVYKIISRHNGQIWAESKPGYGATFYFQI
ncbi:MAG: hypothetical protein C0601_05110 [Candidatus Muiribacterium halophilum]|uniref:histidine kinase n=1 Tax=Muiribacterium halophilum TaxID=2053465 RepID=A0A2N5ZI96_MUIH1|nr:MAG: hypothetical protein C0601_05110 [Candidatus Muirbacterium halophilum]